MHDCFDTNTCFFILLKQRFADLLLTRRDQEWEAQKAASHARRTPRKSDIYRYAESRGINSSLIRPLYELPIDTIASPQKKSRQGITIRRNKQSTSIPGRKILANCCCSVGLFKRMGLSLLNAYICVVGMNGL